MFIKRTLTTMQITQFLVGSSYAMAHSFVSYYIPVLGSATAGTASASASAAAVNGSAAPVADAIAYEREAVPCVTAQGSTLAIWLNVFYLAPLTYLFVSFFIDSYIRRSNAAGAKKAAPKAGANVAMAEKAGWEAAKATQREVYGESNEQAEDARKGTKRTLRKRA